MVKKKKFYFTFKGERISDIMKFEDYEEAHAYCKKYASKHGFEFVCMGIKEATEESPSKETR